MRATGTVYTVELRAPSGDDKPHLRLRAALKCLWRSFGLKAISVGEKSADATAGTEAVAVEPQTATTPTATETAR